MKVRDLPEGDDPVTIDEMTELLVEAVPEDDRPLARQVVSDGILSVELGVAADEPAPRHLAEDVYEDLAEVLEEAAPEERLAALMAEAQVAFVQEQLRASLTLGIARYIKDNPGARETAAECDDAVVNGDLGFVPGGLLYLAPDVACQRVTVHRPSAPRRVRRCP